MDKICNQRVEKKLALASFCNRNLQVYCTRLCTMQWIESIRVYSMRRRSRSLKNCYYICVSQIRNQLMLQTDLCLTSFSSHFRGSAYIFFCLWRPSLEQICVNCYRYFACILKWEGRRQTSTSQVLPSWILPQRVDLFRLLPVTMPVGGTDPCSCVILTSA